LAIVETSRNNAAALANATFAFSARKTAFPAAEIPGGNTMHLAAEASARAACLAESMKIRSADEARSGAATPVSSIIPSPSTTAPIAAAKLFAVCFITLPDFDRAIPLWEGTALAVPIAAHAQGFNP